MAKILNRVLGLFGSVYRTDSDFQAPGAIDVQAPVQPVHDVSDMAERAAARFSLPQSTPLASPVSVYGVHDGILQLSKDWTEAGAGTVYNTLSIDDLAQGTYGLDLDKYGLIMDYLTAVETAGNPAATIMMAWLAGGNQAGAANVAPVFIWSTGARMQYDAAGNYTYPPRLNGALTPLYYRHLPMQVPRYATLYLRASFCAAGTIRFLAGFRTYLR